MSSWQIKKISKLKKLGDTLQEKREKLDLTLSQVSKQTMIAERYLQFLEDEDWQRLPGDAYIKNFLKKYAVELNLDPVRVLKAYSQRSGLAYQSSISSLQKTLPLPTRHFIILPKIIKNSLAVLVVLVLAGYLIWQVNGVLAAPALTIYSPVENLVTAEQQVVVSGSTELEVEININGIKAVVSNGKFSEIIDLQLGLNTIEIIASKRYGKEQIEHRKIIKE